MIRNKYARKYCRRVKKWLPGTGKYRRQILNRICAAVDCFIEEQPEADYAALEKHFGTPSQIASDYVTEMDTGDLLRNLRIKRKVVTTVVALAVTVVAMWAAYMTILIVDGLSNQNGYIEVEYSDGRKGVMVEWDGQ